MIQPRNPVLFVVGCPRSQSMMAIRTSLLITHDMLHASRADLIVYVDAGRVIERGTHDELLARNGPYARIYNLQRAQHLPAVAS